MNRRRSLSPSSPTSCGRSVSPSSPTSSGRIVSPSSPSSSVTALKTEKTAGIVYAVFECFYEDEEYQFLIYKLDSAAGKDDRQELGQPIWRIKKSDSPYKLMSIFSTDSKLYFIGGYQSENLKSKFSTEAYKVDTSMFNSNSGDGEGNPIKLTLISPMNSPKPRPWVIGPIDGHKFYIITESLFKGKCSFELFDTSTDRWEPLDPPDVAALLDLKYLSKIYLGHRVHLEFVFNIWASAVFGTFICLSTHSALFLYCTKERKWTGFCRPQFYTDISFPKPNNLPFLATAFCLFRKENISLGLTFEKCVPPVVYKSRPNLQVEDFERGDIFKDEGDYLEGLEKLKDMPEMLASNFIVGAACCEYDPRIFIIRHGEDPEAMPHQSRHFVIDICDVSLMEGDKVKIENTVSYKHQSNTGMLLRHFFVVG